MATLENAIVKSILFPQMPENVELGRVKKEIRKRAGEGCILAQTILRDLAQGGSGVANVHCDCKYCSGRLSS